MFWRPGPTRSAMAHRREIAHHRLTESPGLRPMTKTVLIVEDNELNMKLFHDLLDAHGYKTLQTRNGMEALALAREHRPDVVLMDVSMPDLNGLDATAQLKQEMPEVRVIVLSMHANEEYVLQALRAGASGYLLKDSSIEEVA